MVRGPTTLLVLLLLASAAAGCVGEDMEPAPDDEPHDDDEPATGSISGIVVDASLEGVPDALVLLSHPAQTGRETSTDEEGGYLLEGLEPGQWILQVVHSCCHQYVKEVYVEADTPTERDVQLVPVPKKDPRVEVHDWRGFIGCGFRLFIPATLGCGDPNHEVTHEFEAQQGLETILIAMEWDTSGVGDSALEIQLERERDSYVYDAASGTSPVELRIDSDGHGRHNFTRIKDEPWTFFLRLRPAGPANVIYQQPAQVWYELHYWEPAPDGASALPEP